MKLESYRPSKSRKDLIVHIGTRHVKNPQISIEAVALSFLGFIFSGSVIYWEYAAGNPITYQSYSIIYSLGYHYNLASYFTTYWLTYYQVIDYVRDIITIKVVPYVGPLFDYNKNDLFYLANDVSLGRYQDALHDMANSTVIYNDGINIITRT